jgi:hypothetical protein
MTPNDWPWHMKVTYADGSIREDDYANAADPVGLARFKSSKVNVERVELTTVFVAGEQIAADREAARCAGTEGKARS